MFTSLQRESAASAACSTVETLARLHFSLGPDVPVVVVEQPTTLPGCPPWETVINFWTDLPDGSTQRHHCKVFKPARQVCADDLPPGWMKTALAVPPHIGCACC